jgi:eukaryotic-like serine/threonine-protein kinase
MNAKTMAEGRFRIERALGGGAMAKVLLARDEELDRPVALKVLDERLAVDESFRARFSREARFAAGLSHPNVVTVFDVGETDGQPFIVTEYVEGRTLADRLREEGPLPANEVERLAQQICAGLEHAHEHGLVHRDLKPGNLIERVDGTVKIADFGIARAAEATELTEVGTILGTAAYLAPEQAEGGVVSPRTDLFALGLVFYELLTAQRPWEVERLPDLARRRTTPPQSVPPGTPPSLAEAIERCLQIDPESRPASAAEVAALLERSSPAPTDSAATQVLPRSQRLREAREAPRRRAPRSRARRPSGLALAAIVAAVVFLVAALAAAALTRGDEGGSGGGSARTPSQRAEIAPPEDGATPEEDARNLARWLRENSR